MQVMVLSPVRVWPVLQATSTTVPTMTGKVVVVVISDTAAGSSVHVSEKWGKMLIITTKQITFASLSLKNSVNLHWTSTSNPPSTQTGVSTNSQFLSLIQVISLLPERLYPGTQSTSTVVPWSTGSEVLVVRSNISGSPVHLSENINHHDLMRFFDLSENVWWNKTS